MINVHNTNIFIVVYPCHGYQKEAYVIAEEVLNDEIIMVGLKKSMDISTYFQKVRSLERPLQTWFKCPKIEY